MQQSRAGRRRLHRPKPVKRRQVPQERGPGYPVQALWREYHRPLVTFSNLPFSPSLSLCCGNKRTKALNKKEHRDSESPDPEEPFSLTPHTEEKYKKIDEEFDKMMQSYRLSVSTVSCTATAVLPGLDFTQIRLQTATQILTEHPTTPHSSPSLTHLCTNNPPLIVCARARMSGRGAQQSEWRVVTGLRNHS